MKIHAELIGSTSDLPGKPPGLYLVSCKKDHIFIYTGDTVHQEYVSDNKTLKTLMEMLPTLQLREMALEQEHIARLQTIVPNAVEIIQALAEYNRSLLSEAEPDTV